MGKDEDLEHDRELINQPAHGIQPGAEGAEADARQGLTPGTPPDQVDPHHLREDEPVHASDLDPEEAVDAMAGDLKPDTEIVDQ